MHAYTYTYIYVRVCMCVCARVCNIDNNVCVSSYEMSQIEQVTVYYKLHQ